MYSEISFALSQETALIFVTIFARSSSSVTTLIFTINNPIDYRNLSQDSTTYPYSLGDSIIAGVRIFISNKFKFDTMFEKSLAGGNDEIETLSGI